MRILVVDDDIQITTFLKSSLKAECFTVDCANDGKRGSFLARTNEYDLIILDLVLPEKNGLDVCREIRADGIDTPIIILSVKREVPDRIELLKAGADDYISKPFSFDELVARIRAIIRRPKKIDSEKIKLDQYEIDVAKNEVKKDGQELIALTRKECELLAYLAKNRDKVVTRGTLFEHVWDMNADPFSNTVEVHIRNIRKKLGLSAGNSIIRTISGRGYILDTSRDSKKSRQYSKRRDHG